MRRSAPILTPIISPASPAPTTASSIRPMPAASFPPTNSGGCTLTLTSNGTLSLSLSFPGLTLKSTNGASFPLYEPAGIATAQLSWKGLDGKPLTNYLSLDLTNGAFTLSGTIANAKFSSSLHRLPRRDPAHRQQRGHSRQLFFLLPRRPRRGQQSPRR